MSKKVFLAVLMLSLTSVLAFAESLDNVNINNNFNSKYKWTELSKEIISPYDEGSVCRLSADLEMTGGVLYLTINNVPYAQGYVISCNETNWRYSIPVIFEAKQCIYNFIQLKYKVEGLTSGKKSIRILL
ncbi:MAG: hypothetical protein J6C81_02210 [Muribaculaceae bacterium]|nr:hypothetical protein [Muribaculaceae bacterium]